jgi:hypothetical protein
MTKITSNNQSGGITAKNINIKTTEEKKPSKLPTWTYITGSASILSAIIAAIKWMVGK